MHIVIFPIKNDPIVLSFLEKSYDCQPYVQKITVRIDSLDLPQGTGHPLAYSELRGEMLRVELTVAYQGVQVVAGLQFVPDLKFPLMYVKEIRV